jgi:hypothetical protein
MAQIRSRIFSATKQSPSRPVRDRIWETQDLGAWFQRILCLCALGASAVSAGFLSNAYLSGLTVEPRRVFLYDGPNRGSNKPLIIPLGSRSAGLAPVKTVIHHQHGEWFFLIHSPLFYVQ